MKHEMTAREYLRAQKRMCKSFPHCEGVTRCPFLDECGKLTERGIEIVEEWAAANPEPRKTVFVPDEIVNEVTFEATYVDKSGVLLTDDGKKIRMKLLEELVKHALPQADNVRCVKLQQFVTKGHEEEC